MKNLTTPQAILCGLGLIALAITVAPYSSSLVKPAYASNGVHKIAICDENGNRCAGLEKSYNSKYNGLKIFSSQWN